MTSKLNGTDVTEWARAPPTGSFCNRFLKTIYNPEDKSFLGRTAKRWGIVLIFYGVFYLVLALLFGLCMGGLFLSLDTTRPTYTLEKSLIGANPGVTARPMPPWGWGFEVRINKDNSSSIKMYTDQLDDFLKPYAGISWFTSETVCNIIDNYGLPDTPCFFIKLNKIFDWMPQFYDDVATLPADMPQDLVEHIKSIEDPAMRKKIWISCFEEKSNLTKIEYPWGRGLPASFYPFTNSEGYLSPLVAVKFLPPANTHTVVRCRAWAQNIIYNKSIKEGTGYARIMVFIEDNSADEPEETT